jgi:hypothetical protein
LGITTEPVEGAEGSQERFLGQILGDGRVPHHAQCCSKHEVLMPPDQLTEGVQVICGRPD